MARNQVRVSRGEPRRAAWPYLGRLLLSWGAVILLLGLMWVEMPAVALRQASLAEILGVFMGLPALLAIALERGLAGDTLAAKWRYRLAFVLGASLPALSWASQQALRAGLPGALTFRSLGQLGLLFLGAWAGSLVVTALNTGLWEDNSPPAERLQAEVYQAHQAWTRAAPATPLDKRVFDLALACFGLVLSAPVWLLSIFLIWLEDPGPVFFVKNSVGKNGVNFRQFKLRTMVCGAEDGTGPVLSQQGDRRVLVFGKFLRKTALDELPQLFNILRGEMSFVGPRPQRTVLVHSYLQSMPEYAGRHAVLPGLAGLAQVAGDYYLTPRQKLRFDRLYIRYAGLGFDLKLILLACMITFWYRWRKDWDGRLPRGLFRWGSRPAR
ncbi:MAG: sugar transferase [Chloroflexota bacterium]